MTHLYFHYSSADELIVDHRGTEVLDLIEARERATAMAQSIVTHALGVVSFGDWHVHVTDEDDEELLTIPFTAIIGRLH